MMQRSRGHRALDQGPGITNTHPTIDLGVSKYGSMVKPEYGLVTSTKVTDAVLGDTVTTNNYGADPELGLLQSSTADPGGLNYTSSYSYENKSTPGACLGSSHAVYLVAIQLHLPTMGPMRRPITPVHQRWR